MCSSHLGVQVSRSKFNLIYGFKAFKCFQSKKENSRKRPRQYMSWGEPDDEEEVPIPRRTLLRKLQPVHNTEEVI